MSAAGAIANPGLMVATCDSCKRTVKGKQPMIVTYDRAVTKK